MTAKQKRFCAAYAATLNAAEAARRAGYSEATARQIGAELLTKPYIRDFCDRLIAEDDDRLIAEAREILRYLTATMRDENAKQADRLRAAEGLARFQGLFAPEKKEIKIDTPNRPRVMIYLPEIDRDDDDDEDTTITGGREDLIIYKPGEGPRID